MEQEANDSLTILAYHVGGTKPDYDTFYVPLKINNRALYYFPSGTVTTPTVFFDGTVEANNTYSAYRSDFNTRYTISSPIAITLTGYYNSSTRNGSVNVHIDNTTGNALRGTLQFVVTETDINYSWGGETKLYDVVRNVIPSAGEVVSIPAKGSLDKVRSFSVDTSWQQNNCSITAFVQDSTQEIYQTAKTTVMSMGVEENIISNPKIELHCFPNLFTNNTCINYSIPDGGNKSIGIYDIAGNLVKEFSGGKYESGNYKIYWDGCNNQGNNLAPGIYFCILNSGEHTIVNKIIKVK